MLQWFGEPELYPRLEPPLHLLKSISNPSYKFIEPSTPDLLPKEKAISVPECSRFLLYPLTFGSAGLLYISQSGGKSIRK